MSIQPGNYQTQHVRASTSMGGQRVTSPFASLQPQSIYTKKVRVPKSTRNNEQHLTSMDQRRSFQK